MRDILFRGKTVGANGKFVYGNLIWVDDYCCILERKEDLHPMDEPYLDGEIGWIDGKATPVRPETVGQFTGLTGKNGVKIFEGDVVQIHSRSSVNGEVMAVIAFHHGCFGYAYIDYDPYDNDNECPAFDASYDNNDHLAQYAHNFIKVIGNIYDNPELLEVK